MKKLIFIGSIVACFILLTCTFASALSNIQITACESAHSANTCDKLDGSGLVTDEECCSALSKCCNLGTNEFKTMLIEGVKDYFSSSPTLTTAELKDLIVAYFSTTGDTVDLSGNGKYSGENLNDIYNKSKTISPPTYFPYSLGDYYFSLVHDGLTRKYIVHIPPSYDKSKPTPVILAFHGGGGNAERAVESFQLNSKSDSAGFIVVYPEGTGKVIGGKVFGSWNAGRCCPSASDDNVDDVGFIKKMIEKLEKDFNINENRIYATGMSNGAMMSYRLACELSDKIAAIAPSGGHDAFDGCKPTRPVPVLHFHGTEDQCALYNGGECGGCMSEFLRRAFWLPVKGSDLWMCTSVSQYVNQWKKINKCSDNTKITFQNGDAKCVTYQECQDNAEVTLCTIDGMGHNWPGKTTYDLELCQTDPEGRVCKTWKEIVGPLNDDINANDAMWEFFKKYPITTCIPATCTSLDKQCGSWDDGCGGILNCGTCSTGLKNSNFGLHAIYDRTNDVKGLNITLFRAIYHFDSEQMLRNWLKRYQDAGLDPVLTFTPNSKTWGNSVINSIDWSKVPGGAGVCGFPSDVEAYKADLKKLIEGIDGDGKDDYPELRYPIKYVQIGNEVDWQWCGSPPSSVKTILQLNYWRKNNLESVWKSYGEFLKITYETIKAENPSMLVILGGTLYGDPALITQYQREFATGYGTYFDAVDIHVYLPDEDYSWLEGKFNDLKPILPAGKPIWGLEIGGPMQDDPFNTPEEFKKHAEGVVKIQTVLFGYGFKNLFWSSLVPTVEWGQSFLNTALLKGQAESFAKKPAYYTEKLLVEKLDYFKSVTKLSPSEYYYKFEFSDKKPVFVLWSKSGQRTIDFSPYISSPNVKITHIITEQGKTYADIKTEIVSTNSVIISETPVFIETVGCIPATCTSLDKQCGSWDDGCGGTLNCGTCSAGKTCTNGQCVTTGTT